MADKPMPVDPTPSFIPKGWKPTYVTDRGDLNALARNVGRNTALAPFLSKQVSAKYDFLEEMRKRQEKALEDQVAAQEKAAEEHANRPWVQKAFDNTIGKVDDVFMKALDVAFRPVSAVQSVSQYLYAQDEDNGQGRTADALGVLPGFNIFELLQGGNPADFIDDLEWSDLGGAWNAFEDGIMGRTHVRGSDVLRANAAKDGKETIHDKGWYQATAGFASDVAFDPLTYVGAGLARNAVYGGRTAINAVTRNPNEQLVASLTRSRVRRNVLGENENLAAARGVSSYLTSTMTAKEMRAVLTGSTGRISRESERIAAFNANREVAEQVTGMLYQRTANGTKGIRTKAYETRVKALQDAGVQVSNRRNAILGENAVDTFADEVLLSAAREMSAGRLTADGVDELAMELDTSLVRGAIADQAQWNRNAAPDSTSYAAYSAGEKAKNAVPMSRQEWDAQYKTFESSVGKILRGDPRFTDDMVDELEKGISQHPYKALPEAEVATYRANMDALRSVRAQRAQLQKDLPKLTGPAAVESKAQVANMTRRIRALQPQVDKAQAAAYVKTAQDMVRSKMTGQKFYSDPQRAPQLQQIIARADNELSAEGNNIAYVGTQVDRTVEATPAGLDSSVDDIFRAENEAGFKDSAQRAQYYKEAAQRELKQITTPVGRMHMEYPGIPERLATPDGAPNIERLRSLIGRDKNGSLFARVKEDGAGNKLDLTPDETSYIKTLVEDMTNETSRRYVARLQAGERSANEASRRTATTTVIKSNYDRALAAGDDNAKAIESAYDGKGFTIKNGDDTVRFGSEEAERLPFNAADRLEFANVRKTADSLKAGKTIKPEDAARVHTLLVAKGHAAPKDPKFLGPWLVQNSKALDNVTLGEVVFARKFANEHGMTLAAARNHLDLAAETTGKVIRPGEQFLSSRWGQAYPEGVTKAEFIERVLESPTGLKDMLTRSAPFRASIRGGKNDLDANGFNAWVKKQQLVTGHVTKTQAQYADEYSELMWKAFNDDPALAVKTAESAWRKSTGARKYADTAPVGLKAGESEASRAAAKADADRVAMRQESAASTARISPDERKAILAEEQAKVLDETLADLQNYSRIPEMSMRILKDDDNWRAAAARVKNAQVSKLKAKEAAVIRTKNATRDAEEIKALDAELAGIKTEIAATEQAMKDAVAKAAESRKALQQYLDEDALGRTISMELERLAKGVDITFNDRRMFTVPGSRAMHGMMERAGDTKVVAAARQAYAATFKPPIQSSASEVQLAANRAISNTPGIIKSHLDPLNESLGRVPLEMRTNVLDQIRRTDATVADDAVAAVITKQLEDLVPYFNRGVKVRDSALTADEIAKYLPKQMQVNNKFGKRPVKTPQDLLRYLTPDKSVPVKDPLEFIWTARVAVENAMAHKGFVQNINDVFGVRRHQAFVGGHVVRDNMDAAGQAVPQHMQEAYRHVGKLVEEYKDLGWQTIEGMGNTHYFPPSMVPEIKTILEMMDPKNISGVMRTFDKITNYWKAAVTTYNPAYYGNTIIGEAFSGYLGGVKNPIHYARSTKVINYMKNDGAKLEALKSHQPWAKHLEIGPKGSDVLFTAKGGQKYSVEDVTVLYADQGLRTGFVNTNLADVAANSGSASGFAKTAVGQKASRVNEKVRKVGETVEDWPRIAHFVHALQNAPKNLTKEKAAQYAAGEVRKYHFNYADLSKFEKTVMMRVFPFYTWTRKSVPLMTQMMFTRPGRVLMYPKAMTAMTELTTDDMVDRPNAFMPNYTGIVPQFIQDQWAYRLGIQNEQGQDVYGRLPGPLDAFMRGSNAGGTAVGLMNPLIKIPTEQVTGGKLGGSDFSESFPGSGDAGIKRFSGLMDSSPQTNFLDTMGTGLGGGERGASVDKSDAMIRFLTGIGVYTNNADQTPDEGVPPVVVD